jgi:5-aminolevulinate synthase
MGPALSLRSGQITAGYASVAGNLDVNKIHQANGVFPAPGAGIEQCPHASAARAAARMAEDLAAAAKKKEKARQVMEAAASASTTSSSKAAAAGCPFHQAASAESSTLANQKAEVANTLLSGFNYEQFYVNELDKKHKDNSYRYFNNINRLAGKFPVAHTNNPKEEVEVWCANDYLGMGNNPVVLETMQ